MPVFNIYHLTRYDYDRPVKESVNEIRIFPYACAGQEVLNHEVMITGSPQVFQARDYWGNMTGMFNQLHAHRELVVESKLIVRTLDHAGLPSPVSGWQDLANDMADRLDLLELSRPAQPELLGRLEHEWMAIGRHEISIASVVSSCADHVFNNFQYRKGITTVETTVREILDLRSGVCQDFAHLMLELLRARAVPCRYVSGYICPNRNGMRGEGATHAWVEAWIPGSGWAGIDPTNNVWVRDTHVKLAVGRSFKDCSPVRGTFKGTARQSLSVYVSVGYEDGGVSEELNDVHMGHQLAPGAQEHATGDVQQQ